MESKLCHQCIPFERLERFERPCDSICPSTLVIPICIIRLGQFGSADDLGGDVVPAV